MFKIVLILSITAGFEAGGAFGQVVELSPVYETMEECVANSKRLKITDNSAGNTPYGHVKTYPMCIKK